MTIVVPLLVVIVANHVYKTMCDAAFVRVRPAFAGEGRYFVRVPPGTNASDYQPMKPKVVPEEKLDIDYGVDVGLDPEVRAQAFLKYLEEQDKGYDGDFGGMVLMV